MLRVSDGDCIFLEFAFDDRLFNILVDTGPASCWETVLRPFLDQLFEDKKKIDVLLITHIDGDHIGGALKLFDNEKYSNLVKEVWFNGLKQIAFNAAKEAAEKEEKAFRELRAMHWHDAQEVDGPISAKQAESLVSLLVKRGKEANAFFQGFPITNNTASIQLSPEFYIDFLLPTVGKLEKMKSKFHIAMNQVVRGSALVVTPDSEVAFEHVMLDEWTEPDHIETISENNFNLSDVEKWGSFVTGKDSSITNASSIAICVRFYGRKLFV